MELIVRAILFGCGMGIGTLLGVILMSCLIAGRQADDAIAEAAKAERMASSPNC